MYTVKYVPRGVHSQPTRSEKGLAAVKRMLAGEAVDAKSSGLSAREWRELMQSLGRQG